jgi:hypothetical protein
MRRDSQDAIAGFRPFFGNSPVYGNGPSLEETMRETPLSVGSLSVRGARGLVRRGRPDRLAARAHRSAATRSRSRRSRMSSARADLEYEPPEYGP